MCIDDIRIFYDVVDDVVEIIAVIAKPQATEWLAREGKPAAPNTSSQDEE